MAPLLAYFQDLEDPRWDRFKLHPFNDILFITICAAICGADGWKDIEAFAHAKEDWLRGYLELPHGLPSDDTFRRVISRINPEAFETCFRHWVASVVEGTTGELICIDGKTLRGSYDAQDEKAALCMVSAWASANGLIMAQERVDQKSNEITAIPALLSALELSGCLVTIDAMGTQREIARQITDQGGQYVLALKSNHPTLYEDVRTFFEEAQATQFQGIAHDYAARTRRVEHTDGGHGRIEVRRCWAVGDVAWLRHQDRWAGLRTLVLVESRRIVGTEERLDRRYYIASAPADAASLLAAVRGHWGIENRVHWVLDVSFGEDGSRIRKDHGAANMSLLRRLTLNLIRREPSKGSLKGKRKRAGWDNRFLEKILTG
ncbi:ISAs1 family transposase [Rhodocaloribacter litoris]|uniref:ISAs1 family transposase n=1 Tax=Rhodocaloribacter litoris TaxID=2558931 RepID=UPI00142161CF|nr:ISAs1 family transposase [Rhodocaloribacter litoris]QXD15530.1 ISAs1 family transposase [Rhodocaloribacter litoris]